MPGPARPSLRRLALATVASFVLALSAAAGLASAAGGTDGTGDSTSTATPFPVPPFVAIAAGGLHGCALTADGAAWCWEYNEYGQLGNGTKVGAYDLPVQVIGVPALAAISAGGNTTCAVDLAGGVWCWGENDRGQVGDGTTTDRAVPAQVALSGPARTVSVGYDHVCATLVDGSAACWGHNLAGQLGDGTTEDRLTPVAVTALRRSAGAIASIAAGGWTTCAVTADGSAWCWGSDTWGQIPNAPGGGDATAAIRIEGLGGPVKLVADGDTWTCALRTDGVVLCWGDNSVATGGGSLAGALGTGNSETEVRTPEIVKGLPAGIVDLQTHSWSNVRAAALAPDGSVWTWGANEDFAVGAAGGPALQVTPIRALDAATAIGAGGTFTAVIIPGGGARWWGDGDPAVRVPWSGAPAEVRYRPPGTLVPAITTAIPTPDQISASPAVIGANLLLAALAMLAFTGASELLNRTVGDLEPFVRRRLRPAASFVATRARIDARITASLGHDRRGDVVRVVVIAAFYGIVYALLDPTWNPLSITGLWLVLSFAVACGLVGISDDFASWTAAKRFGVAGDMNVRPGSLLTALASTLATRVLVLVPGVMIGTPEALDVEEEHLDRSQKGRLAAAGLGAVGIIGGGAWLLTLVTGLLSSALPAVAVPVDGLQAFLLLVFAVALQNAFVQLLAFRNSAGRALLHVNRVAWGVALLAVTFLFWHTLVNPRGDLAEALGATNVRAFLATVGVVLALSVVGWLVARRLRQQSGPAMAAEAPVADEPNDRTTEPPSSGA